MTAPIILSVQHTGPGRAEFNLDLSTDHPAFAGHFPHYPVLPGVIQTHWAVRLGAEYMGSGCLVATDFQVKFRRIIQPGRVLDLFLFHDQAKGNLSFEYRQGGVVASTGRIRLGGRQ